MATVVGVVSLLFLFCLLSFLVQNRRRIGQYSRLGGGYVTLFCSFQLKRIDGGVADSIK